MYDAVGKLHNLARAVADEETEPKYLRGEGTSADQKVIPEFDKDGVLGIGLRVVKQRSLSPTVEETSVQPIGYNRKDAGKRLFGPISTKPTSYLSQFILHIAAIGDIVDGTDTTHDFNFFSLVYEWPKDVSLYTFCIDIYVEIFAMTYIDLYFQASFLCFGCLQNGNMFRCVFKHFHLSIVMLCSF